MTSTHVHLHFYPQEQIKPRLRGNLIYVLELPGFPGEPVIRQIYDPTGRDFPPVPRPTLLSIAQGQRDCIIFTGVNKASVYDVMAFDPPLSNNDPDIDAYTHQLLRTARRFFLTNPDPGRQCEPGIVSPRMAELLSDSCEKDPISVD